MTTHVLHTEQRIARPLNEVFEFFSSASNLERITPPWLNFSILGTEPASVSPGTVIPYRLRLHGIPMIWVSQIEEFEPGRHFVDRQLVGPYKLWVHRHEFTADGDSTLIRDEVRYALPLGRIGDLARRLFVLRDLERVFEHRHTTIETLFA